MREEDDNDIWFDRSRGVLMASAHSYEIDSVGEVELSKEETRAMFEMLSKHFSIWKPCDDEHIPDVAMWVSIVTEVKGEGHCDIYHRAILTPEHRWKKEDKYWCYEHELAYSVMREMEEVKNE